MQLGEFQAQLRAQPPPVAERLVLVAELLAQALLLVRRQRIESRSRLADALALSFRQRTPGGVVGAALALLLRIELGEGSGCCGR